MKRLPLTAATAQTDIAPRPPVMHASALASSWLLVAVALGALAYLGTWPGELVLRLWVGWVAASSLVMLIAGPVAAFLLFVMETWPHTEPETGESRTELVPVNATRPERVGMRTTDVRSRPTMRRDELGEMLDQLDTRGFSVRAWRGVKLACSGRVIRSAEDETYKAFIDILVSHGWLEGRTDRAAGRLTANKAEIRAALEEAGVL